MSSSQAVDSAASGKPEVMIRVENLSKCYQIYDKPQHRLWQGLFRGRKQFFREFWALKDVSFEVRRGETVGIIGRNGSGKSTLLQMICGTLTPTSGTIDVRGRVGALLELGAGFNPEFTGRENVYMNGAILGLSTSEIDARFEDIVAFAEIREFIEQPVKTYSSGMFVRLAFAVIAHVDADILVIDEALAVGDMFFQAKCMLRLQSLIKQGVTVLFVSHDTGAVRALCERCVLLKNGEVNLLGKASDVVDAYIGESQMAGTELLAPVAEAARLNQTPHSLPRTVFGASMLGEVMVETDHEVPLRQTARRYGNGSARILDVKLLDAKHRPAEQICVGDEFAIQAAARFLTDVPSYVMGYSIRDLKGQMVVGSVSANESVVFPPACAGEVFVYEIRTLNRLQAGVYTISVGIEAPVLLNQQHMFLDVLEHATVFRSEFPGDPKSQFHSMVYLPVDYRYARAIPAGANLVSSWPASRVG